MRISIEADFTEAISKLHNLEANVTSVVDEVLQNSLKRFAMSSFRKAPVLTGLLSSTLVDPHYQRLYKYEYTRKAVLIEGTDYTHYQEYNNPNGKSRFLRNSIPSEFNALEKDLLRSITKAVS